MSSLLSPGNCDKGYVVPAVLLPNDQSSYAVATAAKKELVLPFTEALADMHKIAHREYRAVRVLNFGVYLSLIIAFGLFLYLALSPHSLGWVILATGLLMTSVIVSAYRFVWFGTYDRFLKTMAIRRPDSIYSTVFRARAER